MNYILLVVGLCFCIEVQCQRTRDKMYDTISGVSGFRRLNGTHQTGFSSSFSGSVGVLHVVEKLEHLNFVLQNPPAPPYAVVLYPYLFTRENLLKLKNSSYVSAIVLINNTTKMEFFSHESNCPNQFSGLLTDQTCDVTKPNLSWNRFGTGLLLEDFPFPIYYVSDLKEISKIIDCYEKFNSFDVSQQHERSLCSIEIKSFMSAAVNSEVCLRRSDIMLTHKFCDPLEGKNIFATLFPRETVEPADRKVDENEKFIMVTTRMDTSSMFDGIAPGAMDSLVSYVTLLAVAQVLSKLIPEKEINQRNVIFMYFNGESYDYIGSQRFVYDIKKGNFPLNKSHTNPISLENIEFLIDIGTFDDPSNMILYHYTDFELASKFGDLLMDYNEKFDLSMTTSLKQSKNLPPASAHSFLRDNVTFPAVILTSDNYNQFYHSLYDDYENIKYHYKNTSKDFTELMDLSNKVGFEKDSIQMRIRDISSIVAFALYEIITNQTQVNTNGANIVLIDELLYCFLLSSNCRVFTAATPPDFPIGTGLPPSRYVSVQGSFDLDSTTSTLKLMAYLLGRKQTDIKDKANCTHRPYYWAAGINGSGECYLTTQFYSKALSPAFIEENYDWKSGRYSTWTESTWREMTASIFLQPSSYHESLTFSIGVVIMAISFLVVFIINSKSDVLFGNALSSSSQSSTVEPARC